MSAARRFEPAVEIPGFNVEHLSRHSLAVARTAHALLGRTQAADAAFTAALLAEVGQLVLAANAPEQFAEDLRDAQSAGVPLYEIEAARHGYTHAEVGAYLLSVWDLPSTVVAAVASHHGDYDLGPAPLSGGRTPSDAVRVAHLLVQRHTPELADPAGPTEPDLLDALLSRESQQGWASAWSSAIGVAARVARS